MKRGDLVTVATSGDYGKPRPALVIQSDAFDKATTIPREKVGQVFGRLDDGALKAVERALLAFFGLGGS